MHIAQPSHQGQRHPQGGSECALIARTSNAAREHWQARLPTWNVRFGAPDAMTIGAVSGLVSNSKGQRCAVCHDACTREQVMLKAKTRQDIIVLPDLFQLVLEAGTGCFMLH